MALESMLGLLHAAIATAALTTVWLLVRAARAPGAARDVRATSWLVVALCSVAVWSAHLAWFHLWGGSVAQVLWLPAVGATFGAVLAWTVALVRPGLGSTWGWVALWLLDPALLVAAHVALGPESVVVRVDRVVDYGWVYAVHTLLCFAMILAAASLWAGCRTDPSRPVRLVAHVVLVALLTAGVTEVLQLRLMDVVMGLALVVVATFALRNDPTSLRSRPHAGPLLDELGALVLVFDRDDLLADLNAPARAFFSRHGERPPATGTPLASCLPVSLTEALDGVEVRLADGAGPGDVPAVDFVCFAARLSPSTTPPGGSIVVLRPAATTPRHRPDTSETSPHVPSRFEDDVAHLEVESGTLVALGLRFVSPDDAARAAHAIEFVVGSLGPVAIGIVDACSCIAVAPTPLEALLVDVAADWQSRAWGTEPPPEAARKARSSISLSPVLAGELVVHHGPAEEAMVLVATVRTSLAEE